MKKRIYFFIGTTAELIKLAPVIKEAQKRKINFKIISSGQGELLSKEFSGYLKNFKVDISFRKKSKKSSVLLFMLWAARTLIVSLVSLRSEFKGLNENNSYFIIHGDTVSSLLGAIIAKRYGLKLVHVESGLRSFNFFEPFPEELSRYIVSQLTDIHFCPNKWSMSNLKNSKGIKVNTLQNTLIETFWWAMKEKGEPAKLQNLKGKYFVLVMHRQEHIIFGKKQSSQVINYILSNAGKSFFCVLINYPNSDLGLYAERKKIFLTPRLEYKDFMRLLSNAQFICTDGGSNQEEMYYMGKPCLLLRKHTERREGLGQNVILSKLKRKTIKDFLINYKNYNRDKVRFRTRPSKIILNYLSHKI